MTFQTHIHALLLRRTHALQPGQLVIHTSLRHKLVVSPAFHDLAVVKHVDDVGVLDRTQTMCNGNCCASLRSGIESILYNTFRCRVER